MAHIEARDLRTAGEVIENFKNTRGYFHSLDKSTALRDEIKALKAEMERTKTERDQYRALSEQEKHINTRLRSRLERLEPLIPAKDLEAATKADRPTISRVQKVICDRYGLSLDKLIAKRRTEQFIMPRQIAMYLCSLLTLESLPTIGMRFNREHTTVLHAARKIEGQRRNDPELDCEVEAIAALL